MSHTRIQTILNYWFGDVDNDPAKSSEQGKLWFGKSDETDQYICQTFGDDLKRAIAGEYDEWCADPLGRLAIIILFDQFTRNVFRNKGEAFAYDDRALALALDGVATGMHKQLSFFQRVFFYLPLEHAEDKAIQQQCVELYTELLNEVPEQHKTYFQGYLDYAVAHKKIIDRFGRYPHRNTLLQRESTAEELSFLQQPGSSF